MGKNLNENIKGSRRVENHVWVIANHDVKNIPKVNMV